ncbi:MAG: DUF4240 domain-containing protein [Saprospiraceae bacterium]
MTKILNIHLEELNSQLIQSLQQEFGKDAEVELRLRDATPADSFLSEADFWQIINKIDWSQKTTETQLQSAVQALAQMPVTSIYLFADKLSEKLYQLDTRAHGDAYVVNEDDDYLSVDDFLYVRCAIVAEGQQYYENILQHPAELNNEISFEPLLHLADDAYKLKTGKEMNYIPAYNYETYSNKEAWQ